MGCTGNSALRTNYDTIPKPSVEEVEEQKIEIKKKDEEIKKLREEIERQKELLENQQKTIDNQNEILRQKEIELKNESEKQKQREKQFEEEKQKEAARKKDEEEAKRKKDEEEAKRKKDEEAKKKKEEEEKKKEESTANKVDESKGGKKEVLESDLAKPSQNCVFLALHGSFLTLKQKALDRVNEIRLEACNEGVVDPQTKKRFTKNDYKPVKWSKELEQIARIRAMESLLTIGHQRLNNKSIFTVTFNGKRSWAENLAWNFDNANAIDMIDQWYEEKNDWVNHGNGVTGHYESLISSRFKYIGLGWFHGSSGKYPQCLAGAFSDADGLTEEFLDEKIDIIQKIDVLKSSIKNYYLECPDILFVGKKDTIIPRVEVSANGLCKLWLLEEEQKELTFSSSNKAILQINEKTGEYSALKGGKVTITCYKKDKKVYAKKNVEIATEEEMRKKGINLSLFWRNDKTSRSNSYSSVIPTNNPIGSNIVCWIRSSNREKITDAVIEVSDPSLLSVPSSIGEFVNLKVLGSGSVTLYIYTKSNPFCKETITVDLN